ncbi:hypothetical protein QAD02_012197 [Eretmocerus hayati]|uniref:Uncharacterized protein n=1 Tax=Eretmocerus hayati TaxID=131215 RepID=A0ACC2P3R8_9HYME|nr:hypothetical protein QAD02_012197 [Eretmocerus hayati]
MQDGSTMYLETSTFPRSNKDRGIKLDEKFKTLKHLCKLPLRAAVSDNGITYGIFCVVNTVSVLAKTTSVFGKPYNFRELKNLAKNDSVVFAAALMARFYFSRPSRCGPNGSDVRHKIDDRGKLSIVSSPTPMNYIFGSLAHLAVASCIPNVEVCSTYGNMVVIYPIQPIKKGSIIFKPLSSVYEFTPDTARQTMHKIIFNSSCDCRACKEGWSKKLGNPMKELMISADESAVIQKLVEEIQQVKSSISTRVDLDIKLVSKMKKITEKAWEHCPMPSRVTVEAVRTMVKIFEIFYGIGEVSQGDMPTQCKI